MTRRQKEPTYVRRAEKLVCRNVGLPIQISDDLPEHACDDPMVLRGESVMMEEGDRVSIVGTPTLPMTLIDKNASAKLFSPANSDVASVLLAVS